MAPDFALWVLNFVQYKRVTSPSHRGFRCYHLARCYEIFPLSQLRCRIFTARMSDFHNFANVVMLSQLWCRIFTVGMSDFHKFFVGFSTTFMTPTSFRYWQWVFLSQIIITGNVGRMTFWVNSANIRFAIKVSPVHSRNWNKKKKQLWVLRYAVN